MAFLRNPVKLNHEMKALKLQETALKSNYKIQNSALTSTLKSHLKEIKTEYALLNPYIQILKTPQTKKLLKIEKVVPSWLLTA